MRRLRCVAALIGVVLVLPATAGAEFLPGADLVSFSPERQEQGDSNTTAVDISLDGRYVVFHSNARNLFPLDYQDTPGEFRNGGLFRSDAATGALDLVALGDLRTSGTNALVKLGAQNPSINGDGRYISFSSRDQLVAADVNARTDVYVRDMEEPIDSATAFELVSARDGGEQPATYGGSPTGVTGAQVTPESALSADGRKVVFGTQAPSDLPAAAEPTVSNGQLFVRDLDAHTTTLVTRNKIDGTPVGGASTSGLASISADGSTVAWAGTAAEAQTRLQPNEFGTLAYYMWRRVADGPTAPTRRITGIADIDDPDCPESQAIDPSDNGTATGPCYGPLSLPEGFNGAITDRVPALSADGTRVAFLVAGLPRPDTRSGNQLDVFVTDMSAGLTRKASTIELTREIQSAVVDNIEPVKISADGNRILFVSTRREFGLVMPRLTTPFPATTTEAEIYIIHLDGMEIERITRALDGDEIDRTVGTSLGSVALSANGTRVAFTSLASNLFPGDANDVPDAFVASEDSGGGSDAGPQEPPFFDSTPREDADQSAGPALPVSLSRGPGGSIRVRVKAPQAGALTLTARARVTAGRRARLRPVAQTRKRVRRAGLVTIVLKPARRYRRLVRREKRLRSRLEIRFSPAGGGRALVARRTVSFTP